MRTFKVELDTANAVEIWLAKVGPGKDQLTEVPGSKYTATIEAKRTKPKKIISEAFDFTVKANETYRVLAKSNIMDGFYLYCGTNGIPLFDATITFDEIRGVSTK